jgi:hypothetical protein
VEVVVDPDRLEAQVLGEPGDAEHRLPLVGGVDADEVVPPALGDEETEAHASTL